MGGFCLASERLALIQVSEIGIRLARQRGGMQQKSRRKPAWLALHQMPARGASYNGRFGIADRGVSIAAVMPLPAASRVLMSGNEAVARAVWEAGVRVAAAYPGTPSTEMLEVVATYQLDQRAVALELATRTPDAALPNWRGAVVPQPRGFTRRW